jgi:hypothetical protein
MTLRRKARRHEALGESDPPRRRAAAPKTSILQMPRPLHSRAGQHLQKMQTSLASPKNAPGRGCGRRLDGGAGAARPVRRPEAPQPKPMGARPHKFPTHLRVAPCTCARTNLHEQTCAVAGSTSRSSSGCTSATRPTARRPTRCTAAMPTSAGCASPGRVCHYAQISTERAQRHIRL